MAPRSLWLIRSVPRPGIKGMHDAWFASDDRDDGDINVITPQGEHLLDFPCQLNFFCECEPFFDRNIFATDVFVEIEFVKYIEQQFLWNF